MHAPVGVVKDKGQEWVPLCLSYLSAKQPGYKSDSIHATAETNELGQAEAALKAGIELGTAAEATEDAEESGTAAKIGARCAPHQKSCKFDTHVLNMQFSEVLELCRLIALLIAACMIAAMP